MSLSAMSSDSAMPVSESVVMEVSDVSGAGVSGVVFPLESQSLCLSDVAMVPETLGVDFDQPTMAMDEVKEVSEVSNNEGRCCDLY